MQSCSHACCICLLDSKNAPYLVLQKNLTLFTRVCWQQVSSSSVGGWWLRKIFLRLKLCCYSLLLPLSVLFLEFLTQAYHIRMPKYWWIGSPSMSNDEIINGYHVEIAYQKRMIQNLGKWLSLVFAITGIGGMLLYYQRGQLLTLLVGIAWTYLVFQEC